MRKEGKAGSQYCKYTARHTLVYEEGRDGWRPVNIQLDTHWYMRKIE